MRKNFGPQTWFYPSPVLIIGTYDEEGRPNAMNAAWGGIYDTNQIIICLSSHQTTDNIRKKREFTISFATKETMVASDYVGLVSQRVEKNKIEKSGLKYEKSPFIDAPIFTDYPLTLECSVIDFINEGEGEEKGGCNVIAKIINVSADEKVVVDNKIDVSKINFIAYSAIDHRYVLLSEPVGSAFVEGLKLK